MMLIRIVRNRRGFRVENCDVCYVVDSAVEMLATEPASQPQQRQPSLAVTKDKTGPGKTDRRGRAKVGVFAGESASAGKG